MKKLLSILLVLVLVTVIMPHGAFNSFAEQSGYYIYTVEDSKATIINYTGAEGNLTIPATLGFFS